MTQKLEALHLEALCEEVRRKALIRHSSVEIPVDLFRMDGDVKLISLRKNSTSDPSRTEGLHYEDTSCV